ncbi:MAG: hypothetical protein IPM54_04640 [Polyangiaceae bacterium]|nr:hypothetical protein [Polyangiaceae bacterium]
MDTIDLIRLPEYHANLARRRRASWIDIGTIAAMSFVAMGCSGIGYHPLEPTQAARLQARGNGFSAHIERVHASYASKSPANRVDVRIDNETGQPVHIEPERIELARFDSSARLLGAAKTRDDINLGSPVDGAIAGARMGSSIGKVAGSGGMGGGVVGAGVGIAGAALVMLPLAVFAVIDAAILEGEKNLDPGESGTYRIHLPAVPIDDGKQYALVLDEALGLPRGTMDPLPLVRPGMPHLGYRAPGDADWIFVGRVGGGAIRRAPLTAGLGGLEIFMGRQIGRFAFGGFGTFGAGAWGAEMRYRFEPARFLSIVPFFGYGYYPLVGYLGFNAGHGARWGVELQFSAGHAVRFGWPRNSAKVGLFAHAGPVFLRAVEGVGFAAQGGLSFGIF